MKILFVQEYFYPVITGGSEVYSYVLIKELIRRGHDVFVIGGGFSNKLETVEDIPVQRVNLMPSRFLFNVKSIFTMKNVLKKFDTDLIHGNTFHASIPVGLIGHLNKIPNLISVHNLFLYMWKTYFDPIRSSLFYAFERVEFSMPYDKIIASDHNSFRNLKLLGLEKKSTYIPYPIRTDIFYPKKRRGDKIVIGAAGRFYDPSKGFGVLMDLMEEYKDRKDVEFLFVGPYSPKQENALKKFKNLKLVGKVPYSQMPKFYNMMDIFIGQTIAAKEAMACGCVSILDHEESKLWYYHKPELEAMAFLSGNTLNLVREFIYDEKKRKIQSKKAIEFIKNHYSLNVVVNKTLDVYKEITN
jgi:glycosyltransferase involved in cell wall biosynthesis